MHCIFHQWGWPRRRGERDTQVCANCGLERISSIQFGTPPAEAVVPAAAPVTGPAEGRLLVLRRVARRYFAAASAASTSSL
jgi:hypothetical protein